MNRKEIIKLIIVIVTVLMSLFFAIGNYKELNLVSSFIPIIFFLMAIPLFMLYKRDKFKKKKYLGFYDWVIFATLTFIIVVLVYEFLFIIRGVSVSSFDVYLSDLYVSNIHQSYKQSNLVEGISNMSMFLYFIAMFTLFLISFDEIDKKSNKINYIMTITSSLIMIFIYFYYNLSSNFNINNNYIKEKSIIFVSQNYIFFAIMYISILVHKFIHKYIDIKRI